MVEIHPHPRPHRPPDDGWTPPAGATSFHACDPILFRLECGATDGEGGRLVVRVPVWNVAADRPQLRDGDVGVSIDASPAACGLRP